MGFQLPTDLPSLEKKVILVTGGNEGLGKETVFQLATRSPAKIYLAARNPAKAGAALTEIKQRIGNDCPTIQILDLDLASFASIKRAAAEVHRNETRLDILIANAGVMGAKGVTVDGYEVHFGVNHMGHALLIRLLLPLMQQTAQSHSVAPGETRCVILASEAETLAPQSAYKFDSLKGDPEPAGALAKYGLSKLANVHYASQIAQHYPETETGIRFVAIHPGKVVTNLGDMLKGWPRTEKFARKVAAAVLGFVPVEEGVRNQLWGATWPVEKSGGPGPPASGVFYHPVGVQGKGSKLAYDESKALELWEWTEQELLPHLAI